MLKSIARDASREFAKKTAALSARWFANKYWTILKKSVQCLKVGLLNMDGISRCQTTVKTKKTTSANPNFCSFLKAISQF